MQSSGHPRRRLHIWDLAEDRAEAREHKRAASETSEPAPAIAEVRNPEDEAAYQACLMALNEAPQPIELDCLCQLPNGVERSARTASIWSQEVDVLYQDVVDKSDRRPPLDDRHLHQMVHIDLDQVGAFKGILMRQGKHGFQVKVDPKFSGLLLAKLARYAVNSPARQEPRRGLRDAAPHQRIVPKNPFCTYRAEDRTLYTGTLIGVSRLDAVVKARALPELNSQITFCGRRQRKAHVIRRFETGFAALFVDPLGDLEFSADIRLTDEFPDLALRDADRRM